MLHADLRRLPRFETFKMDFSKISKKNAIFASLFAYSFFDDIKIIFEFDIKVINA